MGTAPSGDPNHQRGSTANVHQYYFVQKVKLGAGSFGTVWRAADRKTGELVAMKQLDKARMAKLKVKPADVEREIQMMKKCSHENILRLLANFEDNHCIYLAVEYCSDGDLSDKIREFGLRLSDCDAAAWMKQICAAIAALHEKGVCHRDIKPDNFMLTGKCLKLSDFGLAVLLPPGRLLADKCGTPAFMAPELQQLPSPSPGYTFPVDLWAAGVTFYVIIAGGRHPFASKGQHQLDLPRLLQGKLDFSVGPPPDLAEQIGGLLGFGTERSPDPRFPEAARELCRRMVKVNPAQRITAHQALQHPWILRTHGVKTRGIPQADKENVPRLVAPPAGKITSSNVNATNKATIPLMPAAPDNSSGTLQDLSAESESPRSWPSFIKEIPDATKTQQVELDDQSLAKEIPDATKTQQVELDDQSLAKEAHQHIMEQDRLIQSLQAEIVSLRNESVIDRTAALEADVAHQESVIASLREELALLQPNLKGKLEEAEQSSKKLDNQHQIQGDSSTRQDADVDEATQELRYRPEEEQSHLLQQADVVADEELRRAFEEQSRLLQQKDEEIAERDRRLAEQSTKLEWLESELRAIRESQPESSNCFSCRGQKKSQKRSTRSAC